MIRSIEQTTAEADLAMAFVLRMVPTAVRLHSASVRRTADWDGLTPPIKLQIEFKPEGVRRDESELLLRIHFTLRAVDSTGTEAGEALGVEAAFEVGYSPVSAEQPASEAIAAFHQANAVMHCWPFFREFVQSTVARMHLPVPPVPFLLLNTIANSAAVVTGKTATAKKRPRTRH